MARIRSVHPGLFTDEAFVSVSMAARLLLIGIWTECDDQGVFEWKPLTLKMRLMPADSVDVSSLLEELSDVSCIRRFTADGKDYGAVRNFAKYQRPKKPNPIHPFPDELKQFTGHSPRGSEPVPHQEGTEGENPPQMEDGGGSTEAIASDASASISTPMSPTDQLWTDGIQTLQSLGAPEKQSRAMVGKWLRDTGEDAPRILDAIALARERRTGDPIPFVTRVLNSNAGASHARHRNDRPTIHSAARELVKASGGKLPDFL